jgi:DNA-binding transcriptional LysR family regulator
MMICAAPGYLAQRGTPNHPKDLSDHDAVGFTPSARSTWKLAKRNDEVEVVPRMSITVNSGQAVRMAARAGLA